MNKDNRLVKIESDLLGFIRSEYPEVVVRVERWIDDPNRIAVFFVDERFRRLYPQQRFHYLKHLIPSEYYDANLADSLWFELTPDERPEDIVHPDEELIAAISDDVLRVLHEKDFFLRLDERFCPTTDKSQPATCSGDFRHAQEVLQDCGFAQSEWSDIFNVLMEQGAFCDCEILYNVAEDSRLKANYWRAEHRKTNS